jgi:hypothetical protein
MAIDTELLPCAKLDKIYRQQNAPQLLEIIEDYCAQRYDAALQKIERLGLIRENNTRTDSLKALVADVIEEFKRGQNPLVISPIHRDGKAFAQTLRASMKAQGMLGRQDHEVAWLEAWISQRLSKGTPFTTSLARSLNSIASGKRAASGAATIGRSRGGMTKPFMWPRTVRSGSCLYTCPRILTFTGSRRCRLRSASACSSPKIIAKQA